MPTLSIVKSNYQGLEVNFTEDGWFNATAAADRFGKRPVLYCVMFKHGVMKIGSTSNIPHRLYALSAHGIFKHLFDDIVIESCEGYALYEAENIAINEISKISHRFHTEVFGLIAPDIVRDIFIKSISKSSRCLINPVANPDYHKIATDSGLYNTFSVLSERVRLETSKAEAVEFVISNTPEDGYIDEGEWKKSLDNLHPFALKFIKTLGIRNAVLVGCGLGREDRKLALSNFVSEFKSPTMIEVRAAA